MSVQTSSIIATTLMCHAPIVIPEIAFDRAPDCLDSTEAMGLAAQALVAKRPDLLVVISPHSPRQRSAYSVFGGAELVGSFERFGFPSLQARFEGHKEFSRELVNEARGLAIEVKGPYQQPLDHGALVPLWFAKKAGWTGPVVVIGLPMFTDKREHELLGRLIEQCGTNLGLKVGVIASGDMSHRLQPGAPAGYHERARDFDTHVSESIRMGGLGRAVAVDSELRELAAEDVIDSLAVVQGYMGEELEDSRFLSYEAPFGVGYLIAVLQ